MRVGNYAAVIPEGTERETGHVGLDHGRQYTLRLMNHDHRRCDAEVRIDGKDVGTFRLHPHGSALLERMPNDRGRLTFYSSGTADADNAGEAGVANPDKGLIQVRFVPEKRPPEPVRVAMQMSTGGILRARGIAPMGFAPEEKTAGGITGLSGHSAQEFMTVGAIDRNEAEAVTISLRLVTAASGPRPLRAENEGNPVPAPVQ